MVRLTDRLGMTILVDLDAELQIRQKKKKKKTSITTTNENHYYVNNNNIHTRPSGTVWTC